MPAAEAQRRGSARPCAQVSLGAHLVARNLRVPAIEGDESAPSEPRTAPGRAAWDFVQTRDRALSEMNAKLADLEAKIASLKSDLAS